MTQTGTVDNGKWKEIWEARTLDPSRESTLAQLMAADGLDTGFGDVNEQNWTASVLRTAEMLSITPETSVFDVGCGAGAYLYPLAELGCRVGGIDRSPALIEYAKDALPHGSFDVADAIDLPTDEQFDTVVSCGVFMYFPSQEYAHDVIKRMAAKATRTVALLDVPDAATEQDARAHRIATVGGEEAYAARYKGLDHLYYDRGWISDVFRACGLKDVHVASQHTEGYENARFRFNAWATV